MFTILASDLQQKLALDSSLILIHVLPEEIFQVRRIAGSHHACVYEMTFLSAVKSFVPALNTPIIVYGEGGRSLDSAVATEKLLAAGYTAVTDFRGGLQEWLANGYSLESDGSSPSAPTPRGTYRVLPETSLVRWTGRNLFNHHQGTLRLSGGEIVLADGELRSATFTLDMESIACEDIADSSMNGLLIRHLHDEDFFAVSRFPEATFIADRAEAIVGATDGTPNYLLYGKLTLRGVTQPLVIPAVIAAADETHLTGQAQFELDRTAFGSLYGSGKWFAFLGKHVVNDHISLHLKIQAQRV